MFGYMLFQLQTSCINNIGLRLSEFFFSIIHTATNKHTYLGLINVEAKVYEWNRSEEISRSI